MYIQPFSMEVDRQEIWYKIDVSTNIFKFVDTAFLLCGAAC